MTRGTVARLCASRLMDGVSVVLFRSLRTLNGLTFRNLIIVGPCSFVWIRGVE